MVEIIDGRAIAAQVRREVASEVAQLVETGTSPGLTAILVGDDPASKIYVETKRKACVEVGMFSDVVRFPESVAEEDLLESIGSLNGDARVNGILVQRPLPQHISEEKVLEAVAPHKDVDGFHPQNLGRLLAGNPSFVPATPLGIQELLLRSGHRPEGEDVVIVGRSSLVGRPLAALLMRKAEGANATVTICHSRTKDLQEHTRRATILVVAAGSPALVGGQMVRRGAVVIDVGINRVEDTSRPKGYRIVGDVAFEEVSRVAGAITPVPGGVGPMTVAMLLKNTAAAARLQSN